MLSVGVDVGGTFTDVLVSNSETGQIEVVKVPTTTKDPAAAIVNALVRFKERAPDIELICHASTIATNALLTHAGLARTALITNHGFRDVLEIARQRRPELYNLYTRRPTPLVRRRDRYVVHGRILADGKELESLRRKELARVAARILEGNYQAVAIGFLNAYANPEHEIEMRRSLVRTGFDGHISISSDVDRQYKEYERISTTVVNAALSPLVSSYLSSLSSLLTENGFTAPVYIMNSDGGMSTLSFASKYPITVIESGPAAGVLASRELARALGISQVITFDMGGTTAKAGTILGGEPEISYEFEAAGATHSGRSIKGSGYSVRTPFIDLAEVSSGGGTVAWVDEGGALRIGPESAGSEPGPAAYGKGGKKPTVADANVILGRINPDHLLGGEMPIYRRLAEQAVEAIGGALGLSVEQTAEGVVRIVNNNMAKAISIVSVERGRDPRDFPLFAFGGAGPIHCCDLAEELGMSQIVVPVHAGLFSAFGLLTSDLTRTFSLPVLSTSASLGPYFEELKNKAKVSLGNEGFSAHTVREYVDLRYKGQSYELTLPYNPSMDSRKSFAARHKQIYGYESDDEVEVVNVKVRVSIPTAAARVKVERVRGDATDVSSSTKQRQAWLGGCYSRVPIFTREGLAVGSHGRGPCVIEEYDSTLVVNPGWTWSVQSYGTELARSKA